MINTHYLVNGEFIKVPDSDDPIVTTIDVTEKEINLIKAMRNVNSSNGKYKVVIFTRDEYNLLNNIYSDDFIINHEIKADSDIYEFYNITIHNGEVHYAPHSYMRNKISHETYIVIDD